MRYWDENLLQGPPPCEPLPQVVGITVHLTFARRAYELAAWYREPRVDRGVRRAARAVVPGRGRAARRRDRGRRGRAALAADPARRRGGAAAEGVPRQLHRSPTATTRRRGGDLLPRDSFLTTTSLIATRGCHNRCGFCYLATDGLTMPYQMLDAGAGRRGVRAPTISPTPCSSTTTSAPSPTYLRDAVPRPAAAGEDLERAPSAST